MNEDNIVEITSAWGTMTTIGDEHRVYVVLWCPSINSQRARWILRYNGNTIAQSSSRHRMVRLARKNLAQIAEREHAAN